MTSNTATTAASAPTNGSRRSPCGCPEPKPPVCCCNLVCFDRPAYFCGHLLTDADLTLQQKYVIEKNKLYHRAIDGYGVACGLKLTCDCDCKGNILIHDGFAIDDCGNDLVVCETTRFDVIAALKAKGLLVSDPPEDDCEPRHRHPRCDIKQCFYVTICYDETQSDYETPFQSSCAAGPKECLPTRTHETVRFDVTDKLPRCHSYIEELEERLKCCFELSCDSPVGVILKQHARHLLEIFGEGQIAAEREEYQAPCDLFCTLRAYFLNYLKTHPDQYNCNLYEEVACLHCPKEWSEEWIAFRERRRRVLVEGLIVEEEPNPRFHEELREVFRKLLYYMQRYQWDCYFGDLIFSCRQPCEAGCLVLGTVEVLNGKLVRVCNTPRRYLWAPANLIEVLFYTLRTEGFPNCQDGDHRMAHCCPDYPKFEPIPFLREFELDECGRYRAAKSAADSFKAALRSAHAAYDFTDSAAVSPEIFARVAPNQLREVAGRFGLTATTLERKESALNTATLHQALQSHALLRPNDSMVAYTSEGKTHRVLPDYVAELSPDRSVGREIEAAIHQYREEAEGLARQVRELEAALSKLKRQVDGLDEPKKHPKQGGEKK